jgi:Fic family protein
MRGKTNNDEVQGLLHVSDASAENYLDELEKEGKIRQVGETGRSVEYELNG